MLVKLALCDGRRQQEHVKECCEIHDSIFIPINEKNFGILANNPYDLSLGSEGEGDIFEFNIRTFVDIYNCSSNQKRCCLGLFKKHVTPYVGLILDNQFFLNLISFCESQRIPIKYAIILSKYGTDYPEENIDEIKKNLAQDNGFNVLKLCVDLNGTGIMFSKSGYVDIAASHDFYVRNRRQIQEIISVGFQGEYEQ